VTRRCSPTPTTSIPGWRSIGRPRRLDTVPWESTTRGGHLRKRPKMHTTPEVLLRQALHRLGVRFRLHRKLAPGCTPDIVLPSRMLAIFVDGDFWHSCPVHGRKTPFSGPNALLWEEKMSRNRARDRRSTELAVTAGWRVVRVWECVIMRDPPHAARSVIAGCAPEPEPTTKRKALPEEVC